MHAPDTPIPAQLQAASLLAAGQSPAAVAQALAIHRATLHRWRQQPLFAGHLHQLLQEVAEETAARAGQLALQALAHLEKQFNDPATPPDLRTKLAFRILSLYSRPSALKHLAAAPMRQNATSCDNPQPPSGTKDQAPITPPVTQYALRNMPPHPCLTCAVAAVPIS